MLGQKIFLAVGAGVEPAHSDSINDKLARFVVNPYHLSISYSVPSRREGVSARPR